MSNPDNASDQIQPRFESALGEYHHGQPQKAIQSLQNLILAAPSFEDAYEALSVIYYDLNQWDDAIRVLKSWMKVNPNAVMCRTNLSRCYIAKGLILEAEKEQAEARRLSWMAELKTKKQLMPERNFTEEINRYRQVIELDPKDVLGYYSLGRVFFDAGKKRDAADVLEKAVEVDPSHSSSYLAFGETLESLGDVTKARKIYNLGIKVADERGDMMTLKKMQARLSALNKTEPPSQK